MRVSFVGNRRRLPLPLQEAMGGAEELSRGNKGVHLVFATNYIADFPNPDLLIRTSAYMLWQLRISNYMLWQLAYAELFFTNKLFPDFDDSDDLVEAIAAFQQRQRRYGGI